jgi:quinolinate synthase
MTTQLQRTPDLFGAIESLKKQKDAVILAHYYQDADIQDVADFVGDSLELSRKAAQTNAKIIVFAGVHFMAETAKILSPSKKVLLPDLDAGCSLADACPAPKLAEWKKAHPNHVVVSYINCTAAVKALSDYIVTSSNAKKIVGQIPEKTPILFGPDRNLGAYLNRETGRKMDLWDGSCMVHEIFSEKKLLQLKERHPQAHVIAHPECEPQILRHADHIGSTSSLLRYTQENPATTFIVVTEAGILHQMEKANPHKTFIAAPPNNECACNECPHMKKNTLEKLYACLKNETPEITLDEDLRIKAKAPIDRMLSLS